jgi:hypothetical protein
MGFPRGRRREFTPVSHERGERVASGPSTVSVRNRAASPRPPAANAQRPRRSVSATAGTGIVALNRY